MIRVCLIALFALGSLADENVYNEIVDFVLDSARQYAVQYELDNLPLPDVNLTFTDQQVGPWVLTGSVLSSKGTVKNTTSIRRVGDVTIDLPDDKMTINVNVSFDIMDAHFDVFKYSIGINSGDGGLHLTVKENTVAIGFTVEKDAGICKFTVDKAELTNIGGMEIELLPPGMWNSMKDKVYNLYINAHTEGVEQAVTQFLKTILQLGIDRVDPCHYLPF